MTPKLTLAASAVLLAVFGAAFLLVPVQAMGLFGLGLDLDAKEITRLFGAAMFAWGICNWLARSHAETPGGRAVVTANLLHYLVGFIVILQGRFEGVGNDSSWVNVGLYFLFTVAFAYHQFAGRRAA